VIGGSIPQYNRQGQVMDNSQYDDDMNQHYYQPPPAQFPLDVDDEDEDDEDVDVLGNTNSEYPKQMRGSP
jgi:hypothetical protein